MIMSLTQKRASKPDYTVLQRSLTVLVLMSAGLTALANDPPTREERDKVNRRLNKDADAHADKRAQEEKADRLLANMKQGIEALEKVVPDLMKSVADKDATDPVRIEAERMRDTLAKLKALQPQKAEELDAIRKNANLLQVELRKTLKEYFSKADPKMVADRFGVPFDGVDFNGTAEFLKLTSAPPGVQVHYGLGAEHTWDDTFYKHGFFGVRMKAVSQHEQVTTRDMYDTAKQLMEKKLPGVRPLVGRVGLTHNIDHLRENPQGYKHIFGNQSFPPSVLNNSTRWVNDLEKQTVFGELMELYTRGEGTRTIKLDGTEVTYGLPTIGRPILANSGGNGGWNDRPNFTMQKNFYPFRLNIGSTAQGPLKDANRRDDKTPVALEEYCSASYTDALIQRPRWNTDGSPVKTQYINPKYREVISDNLWRLAGLSGKGYTGTPSEADLADEVKYPPALVKAVKADITAFCKAVADNEGVDADGYHRNLRGTSFAAPTAAGVLLAARNLFPDASEPEIMSAFLAACQPMYYREPSENAAPVDDIMHLTDPKTGWRFSPKGAGYGEFVIRDNATEKNPDSWLRMQEMLSLMRAERMKLTRNGKAVTTVEVGEGPDKHKIALNGQPTPMTMELKRFRDTPSDAMKKRADDLEKAVTKDFAEVRKLYELPAMKDTDDLAKALKERRYDDALTLLKQETSKAPLTLAELPKMLQGLAPSLPNFTIPNVIAMAIPGPKELALKKAEATVKKAMDMREFTYSLTVPAGHDMCCTIASMRLKFSDNAKTDQFIMLESPDGRMVPVTLSDPHSGYEVGSTSGFMNMPALGASKTGVWKIHTRNALDTGNSTMVLGGTYRNAELDIRDVRETVLLPLIQKEAGIRTKVPEKNLLKIADAHATLREWHGITPPKKSKITLKPSTYEDQRDYLEDLLQNSELRKGGFLPEGGKLIRPGINDRDLPTGKTTSRLDNDQVPGQEKALLAVAMELYQLWTDARTPFPQADSPRIDMKGLSNRWGALASAAADGDLPEQRHVLKGSGKGFFAAMGDPDTPLWQRRNLEAQLKASRQPEKQYKA
jgi:hypothetical protein